MRTAVVFSVVLVFLVLVSFGVVPTKAQSTNPNQDPAVLAVVSWMNLTVNLLTEQATLSSPARARALAIVATAIYDAYAIYPTNNFAAVMTATHRATRRVGLTATTENLVASVNAAAYRALYFFFEGTTSLTDQVDSLFLSLGGDARDTNILLNNAVGLGNYAVRQVINYRLTDGANQDGSESPSDGTPYSDYTNFDPINPPQTQTLTTDCATINFNHWQGLLLPNGQVQQFQTPFFDRVKTFAIPRWDYARTVSGVPRFGTPTQPIILSNEQTLLDYSATLDDPKKALVTFWSELVNDVGSAPLWTQFALEAIMNTPTIDLEAALVLLLAQTNAGLDGAINSFGFKRYFQTARPINIIPCWFVSENVSFWAGPYQGVQSGLNVSNWKPYQPASNPSPNHADYTSIHSTISAASGRILNLFFGDDLFRANPKVVLAGSSIAEPRIDQGQPGYIQGVTDVPNTGPSTIGYAPATDIPLNWATWTDAIQSAGLSRQLGGIHTPLAVNDGIQYGTYVADIVWDRVQKITAGKFRRPEFP